MRNESPNSNYQLNAHGVLGGVILAGAALKYMLNEHDAPIAGRLEQLRDDLQGTLYIRQTDGTPMPYGSVPLGTQRVLGVHADADEYLFVFQDENGDGAKQPGEEGAYFRDPQSAASHINALVRAAKAAEPLPAETE